MFKKLFLTILFGLIAAHAYAQMTQEPVSIVASSFAPSPGDTVFIEASTPSFDRNSSFYEWRVDGIPRPELSGLGKTSFTLRAGAIGSMTSLSVIARRNTGEEGSATAVVRVTDLVLTWTAETSVPKWYGGKALPVQRSAVRIVAIPNFIIDGERIPQEQLVYRWSFDDNKRALEGLGEQGFRIRTSDLPGRIHRISVRVEDANQTLSKERQIFITPGSARVSIYAVSPLGGAETRTSSSFARGTKRGFLDFRAEPFFFPLATLAALRYQWFIGGIETASTPQNPQLVTLNTGESPESEIPVSVRVSSADQLIPQAMKTVNLLFQ